MTWTQIGRGITSGVSGLATGPAGGWVVVRDNKLTGQNRVALLGDDGIVTPLTWPGTAPQDLEAISAVPGSSNRFAVVTSAGAGRIVAIDGTTLMVVSTFTLPTGRNQNEGFALVVLGGRTVALWGNRGSSTTPGRLFTATFDPATRAFGRVASAAVTVPFPTSDVRHISDVAVVGGQVVVSSASDPGDNGPFASALYDVGSVAVVSGRPRLTLTAPRSLATYDAHKIEGIACDGTAGQIGSDDENAGGWVAPAAFCG